MSQRVISRISGAVTGSAYQEQTTGVEAPPSKESHPQTGQRVAEGVLVPAAQAVIADGAVHEDGDQQEERSAARNADVARYHRYPPQNLVQLRQPEILLLP